MFWVSCVSNTADKGMPLYGDGILMYGVTSDGNGTEGNKEPVSPSTILVSPFKYKVTNLESPIIAG